MRTEHIEPVELIENLSEALLYGQGPNSNNKEHENYDDTLEDIGCNLRRPEVLPSYVWNANSRSEIKNSKKGSPIRVVEFDLGRGRFTNCDTSIIQSLFLEYFTNVKENDISDMFFRIKFKRSDDMKAKYEEDRKIEQILRSGIEVDDTEYNLIGCSNSQVQNTSFIFFGGKMNNS